MHFSQMKYITLSGMKAKEYKEFKGLKENMSVAKRGGKVAKGARELYEKETKKSVISKDNMLNYKYIDDNDKLENK